MSRKHGWISLVSGLLALVLLLPLASEGGRRAGDDQGGDFGDTILLLYLRGENGEEARAIYVDNARTRTIGKRAFIGGDFLPRRNGERPYAGMTKWFPVEDILRFYEFDDLKSLDRSYEAYRSRDRRADDASPTTPTPRPSESSDQSPE